MKLISVVTACFNEAENVEEVYEQVKSIFKDVRGYKYEHIFIDNASKDRTIGILKELAKKDKNIRIILNARNFGHIRSSFYGLLQARGDSVISMAADLQDPPSMIPTFIEKWESGYKVVAAIKTKSDERSGIFALRRFYYAVLNRLSDVEQVRDFTGFGLYDKKIIGILRTIDDPYPYFRGLISDVGYDICRVEYVQPMRKKGVTKNNIYTLYDIAALGIISHSKVPLRMATALGFLIAFLTFFITLGYFVYKLIFWQSFSLGNIPLIAGGFFISALQLLFIGIVGEYVGAIYTQVLKRPLVIERERINFS